MKSPVSYLTDLQFSALPLGDRALHVARSQVGVKEVPSGSNWGPMVKIFLAFAGWKSPQPWCAAFIGYCIVHAGGKKARLWKGLASTWSLYDWAVKEKRISEVPKRGDLFVWSTSKGGHTGIVAEVVERRSGARTVLYVRTIEGNTNAEGSREGNAVLEKTRSVASILGVTRSGFVDLGGLDW
jgi:hypothetical protein